MTGEISTLSVNKKGFASLKTTIPMSMIRHWDLKPHDKLSWGWRVIEGEMVVIVTKYVEPNSKPAKEDSKRK
jgi:hypothetical protein